MGRRHQGWGAGVPCGASPSGELSTFGEREEGAAEEVAVGSNRA